MHEADKEQYLRPHVTVSQQCALLLVVLKPFLQLDVAVSKQYPRNVAACCSIEIRTAAASCCIRTITALTDAVLANVYSSIEMIPAAESLPANVVLEQ